MPGKELQYASLLPGTLDSAKAREIESEIKRAAHQCRMKSGQQDYPYWRNRLATLLHAAKRYRKLEQHEQSRIDAERNYTGEPAESFSNRLDHALFG